MLYYTMCNTMRKRVCINNIRFCSKCRRGLGPNEYICRCVVG